MNICQISKSNKPESCGSWDYAENNCPPFSGLFLDNMQGPARLWHTGIDKVSPDTANGMSAEVYETREQYS